MQDSRFKEEYHTLPQEKTNLKKIGLNCQVAWIETIWYNKQT